MWQTFTARLAESRILTLGGLIPPNQRRTWAVFVLCLLVSSLGVWSSFGVFGVTIKGFRFWGTGIAIAIIMLGLSYAAKHDDPSARESFTPVDFLQYFGQGFLFPSTWPAIAQRLGVEPFDSPGHALHTLTTLFS